MGIATPDGKLHVHKASAGSVTAYTHADELVVESDVHGGMSILNPSDQTGHIVFGDQNDSVAAAILYDHNTEDLYFSTEESAGAIIMRTANAQNALTIDNSQNATFTGTILVNGTSTSEFKGMLKAGRGFTAGQAVDIEGDTFGRTNNSSVALGYRQDGSGDLFLLEKADGGDIFKVTNTGDTTIAGDLTVDTNTLFVDASADRVGINQLSPSATFQVNCTEDTWAVNIEQADNDGY